MSYEISSILGRLREAIGDTHDDELFTDAQLNDCLTQNGSVIDLAASKMLRRIAHDPELLRQRYSAFGRLTVAELTTFQRQLIEEANRLEDNAGMEPVDLSQDADSDVAFFGTDENSWSKRTSLDSFLLHQEEL